VRVLSVTGGHRVDHDAFFAMLGAIAVDRGWDWAHAPQPSAQRWLRGDTPFDVIVLHDLPGLHLKRGEAPRAIPPSSAVKSDLAAMTERGVGLVVLHHALAGWPSWDGWADALGARFSYAPGLYRGLPQPSSGTCLSSFRTRIMDHEHPITRGLGDFDLDDEPYLFPVFEDAVVPLMRSTMDRDGRRFISTFAHVLVGEPDAPRCDGQSGSDLIAWASSANSAPIAVIQPGDSAATFALPGYRALLANAVTWAGSEDARVWAAGRGRALDTAH
jgi:type 1 glutamine amidotransferase